MAKPFLSGIKLPGSSATEPALIIGQGSTNTAQTGAIEFDGANFLGTPDTTSGRGQIVTSQVFYETNFATLGSAASDFFSANSSIVLKANSAYAIDAWLVFQKINGAGNLNISLVASSTVDSMSAYLMVGPVNNTSGSASVTYGTVRNGTTCTVGATGNLAITPTHFAVAINALVITAASSVNLRLRQSQAGGSLTKLPGCHYKVTQIPATTGTFAA